MKKSKGFTLIELLAVIIVIIVVLAITIPLVSNLIETVRKEAFKATAYSIADSGRFLMANDTKVGYEEFYYLDGKEYNAGNLKLDYTGDGPKTGVVILNERKKVALAIHNGTYCATKSADENKVTISQTTPEKCMAYNIINTCDTWEQIAIKYDVSLTELLKANNVTDSNSSTCGINIKIPISSNSSSSTASGGSKIYYKTYYSLGYTTYSESFTQTTYEYTIKLGVLPLSISDINTVKVTAKSVYETLDDFKRYIIKKNMGEVIWPGEEPVELKLSQASTFKDHALRASNMVVDNIDVECDNQACYAMIQMTVNNMNNVSPNTVNENPIAYLPIKFTVEFNGAPALCATKTTTDALPGTLAGTGTSADPYLIESMEDLVALSNNVNAGNTYSGKYLSLTNTLNFTNSRSYKDLTTTVYGDINGNGVVEGLKVELTTGAGFNPIGNGTNKFSGTLLGNNNCVVNLYINRPTTPYIGLVGYNNGGRITTLNMKDVKVTGGDYTGGLGGFNYNGVMTEGTITGNVTGNNYVGLALGSSSTEHSSAKIMSIMVQGNVTGGDYIGGIVGSNGVSYSTDYLMGINKGGKITSTGTNVGRIAGSTSYSSATRTVYFSGLSLSSVTINGSTVTSSYNTSIHGSTISSMDDVTQNINLAEHALDTYIGGDNDGNGYYWDYDENGIVVQKKTSEYPLNFTLTGTGTSADPYLIYNYDDLRMATLRLGSTYKVMNNIDLTNKRFYMTGSFCNNFTGKFDGNLKTISNLSINGSDSPYIGFTGYNRGTIQGMNLENVDIEGGHYTGAVAGYNFNSMISEISVTGNVTGNTNVGLAVGYSSGDYGTARISSVIVDGNVIGTDYVGGVVGSNYASYGDNYLNAINKGGSVVSTGSNVGRIAGTTSGSAATRTVIFSALADSSVTVNGSTLVSSYNTSINGDNIESMSDVTNNINLAELALDTYIGGDNDGNGYYWDYDGSGMVVQKRVSDYPLTFSLTGAGTTADPYQIYTYDDLRQASLRLGSVHKVMADIDLTGKRFYMMGSYVNNFKGRFDGNLKTISNLTIDAPGGSYIGFVGYNKGTIQGLTLSNINIVGGHYVGAAAGYNFNSTVSEMTISGNVTGNTNVALAVGRSTGDYGTARVISIIAEGNVIGSDYVGGIVGSNHASYGDNYLGAINKGGSIISTGTNIGRIAGTSSGSAATRTVIFSGLVDSSVTLNGGTVNSTYNTSINGANISSFANVMNDINLAEMALDTYIGGDKDGSGYYWDYDGTGGLVQKKTSEYPLTFSLTGSGTAADPYLINSYNDLRQASLKLGSTYKVMSDIDLTGKRFYMMGSYFNNFTGRFDGNTKTISNITIDVPEASYVGFVGYNKGVIIGLNLSNVNIDAGNYVGGIAGYNYNSTISDMTVTGTVHGINDIALGVGRSTGDYGTAKTVNVIVDGNVSGNDYVGGIVGSNHASYGDNYLIGINKGGTISSVGVNAGRIAGTTSWSSGTKTVVFNAAAITSVPVNGLSVTSTTAANIHGLDITSSDLVNSVTYTDRGFNFTDEALDYIWYLESDIAKFRAGNL